MSLNSAVMMGRLTKDPELRYTTSGTAVLSFTVAVDRTYSRPGEERQTDFIDVVAWSKTAEFIGRYFEKGQKIIVEGSLQTRTYTDKNGNKRKAVELVARQVHFAEGRQAQADPEHSSGSLPDGFTPVDAGLDVPF